MLIIRPSHRSHEAVGEQPHVAGEADDLGAAGDERRVDRRVVRVLARHGSARSTTCASMPRDAAKASPGASALVGDHGDDLGRERPVGRGLDQRGHVGAAAGNQDGDASCASCSQRDALPGSMHAGVAGAARCGRSASRSRPPPAARRPPARPGPAATTAIMPMPQLKVRSISSGCDAARPWPARRRPAARRSRRGRARPRSPPAARAECCRESRRR